MPATRALVIDPGGSAFGWSRWENAQRPTEAGVYTPEKGGGMGAAHTGAGWIKHIYQCAAELQFMLNHYKPKLLVVESPFFAPSGKGHATAASGSLVKLATAVGAFLEVKRHFPLTKLIMVEVAAWRGQLDDTLVRQRVKARLSAAYCAELEISSHAWDAVAIGLHYFTGRL